MSNISNLTKPDALQVAILTCCSCGQSAGHWQQHWNRDTGFGICPPCASRELCVVGKESVAQSYGIAGVNFGPFEIDNDTADRGESRLRMMEGAS